MTTSETTGTTELQRQNTPYDLMGGAPVVRKVVDRFYDLMDANPAAGGLRTMHAHDLGPMRDRLFEFLSGWLGGPPLYFQRPDHKCIRSAHSPFVIGEAERDQWMMCMRQALLDAGVSQQVRDMLDAPLLRMCDSFRTR